MTIAAADFLDLADSIAAQSQELAKKMGTGVEADTASLGAVNNYERIAILGAGSEDIMIDLLGSFVKQLNHVITNPNAYDSFRDSIAALKKHVNGVSTFLIAQDERIAPEFKTAIELMGIETLKAENTFSPVVDPMGSLVVDGADSAVWTPGTDIDSGNYYAANLVLEKTSIAGAADAITVTLTCTKWDDTTEDKVVNVDASDAAGTKDDIGIHGTDMYKSVVLKSIVCVVGSIGESWKVISELERTVTL
jgi:hypothetical protein